MSLFGGPLGPTFAASTSSSSGVSDDGSQSAGYEAAASHASRDSDGSSFVYRESEEDVTADEHSEPWTGSSLSKKARDKWRQSTQFDRDAANSLDHLDNDDLSIHLYNAYVLKRQAYDPSKCGETWRQDQLRAKRNLRVHGAWIPHHKWTAWPLKLEDTPLENERWGNDLDVAAIERVTNRRSGDKPSAELQEQLVAECLKHAKLQLMNDEGSLAAPVTNIKSPERSSSRPRSESVSVDNRANNDSSDLEQASYGEEQKDQNSLVTEYAPVPITDDDHAHHVLRPITLPILRDLDRLLHALDRSRLSQNNAASRKRRHSQDRGLTATKMSLASGGVGSPLAPKTTEPHLIHQPKRIPHPRDWSDVLGTALQAGWDPKVVSNAQHRCEQLLGESMLLRTFVEDDSNRLTPSQARSEVQLRQEGILPSVEQAYDTNSPSTSHPASYGWKCPEVSCSKRDSIFTARQEWLSHIEVSHGYKFSGLEIIVPINASGIDPNDFCCPDPDCQRHDWPYPSRWRLQEHMKRSHGQRLERSSSMPGSRDHSPSSQSAVSEEEMHGGVHVDGFLKPIKLRQGWKRGMSRSASRSRERKRAKVSGGSGE